MAPAKQSRFAPSTLGGALQLPSRLGSGAVATEGSNMGSLVLEMTQIQMSKCSKGTLSCSMYEVAVEANCCLERRRYPPEAFVDAGDGGLDSCRNDAMCWTRYEKKERQRRQQQCAQDQGLASLVPTSGPAERCVEIWPAITLTEEEVRAKIKFIGEGCPRKDDVYESLLAK